MDEEKCEGVVVEVMALQKQLCNTKRRFCFRG
jgi:hypothetical protein